MSDNEHTTGKTRRPFQTLRLLDDAAFNKISESELEEFSVQTLVSSRRAFFEWLDGVRRRISEYVIVQRLRFTFDDAVREELAQIELQNRGGIGYELGNDYYFVNWVTRVQVFVPWDFSRSWKSETDKIRAVKSVILDLPVDVDILDRVVQSAALCTVGDPDDEVDTHLTAVPDWVHREYFDAGTEAFLNAFDEFQKQLQSVAIWANADYRPWSKMQSVKHIRKGYLLPSGAFEFHSVIIEVQETFFNLQSLADFIYLQSCAENCWGETSDLPALRDASILELLPQFWHHLNHAHSALNAAFFDDESALGTIKISDLRKQLKLALQDIEANCWYPRTEAVEMMRDLVEDGEIEKIIVDGFLRQSMTPRSRSFSPQFAELFRLTNILLALEMPIDAMAGKHSTLTTLMEEMQLQVVESGRTVHRRGENFQHIPPVKLSSALWGLFDELLKAGRNGTTPENLMEKLGVKLGALNQRKNQLKNALFPLSITIPDGRFRLADL